MAERNMMLVCCIAVITALASAQPPPCDSAGATTCITEFSQSYATAASNIVDWCRDEAERVMGDLNSCIMTALDGCAESEKTMYLSQVPAITDPVNQACMAFNGDGGGPVIGPDGGPGGINPCYISMGQCFGSLQEDMETVGTLFNPTGSGDPNAPVKTVEERNEEQKELCMSLEEVNFDQIKSCLTQAKCDNFSIFGNEPGVPSLSTVDMVDFVQGICEPGCDEYPSKMDSLQTCQEDIGSEEPDINTASCSDIDTYFTCAREKIGSCEAVKKFTESMMQGLINENDVQERCPEVNLSLTAEEQEDNNDPGSASAPQALLFVIVSTLLSSLFL